MTSLQLGTCTLLSTGAWSASARRSCRCTRGLLKNPGVRRRDEHRIARRGLSDDPQNGSRETGWLPNARNKWRGRTSSAFSNVDDADSLIQGPRDQTAVFRTREGRRHRPRCPRGESRSETDRSDPVRSGEIRGSTLVRKPGYVSPVSGRPAPGPRTQR